MERMDGIDVKYEYRFSVISGNDIFLSDEKIPFSKFCDIFLVDCKLWHNFDNISPAFFGLICLAGTKIQYDYENGNVYGKRMDRYAETCKTNIFGKQYIPSGLLKLKESIPYKLVALDVVGVKECNGIITLQRTRN